MTNSTTTGRGRPAIGPRTYVRLEQEVMDELDAWAAERGMKRAEAIRHLVVTGMRVDGAVSTPEALSIQSLFPEAAEASTDEFDELVAAESHGGGEAVEHDYDGRRYALSYHQVRGHWVLEVEEPTEEVDHRGGQRWTHTYTICADQAEARQRYREAIIEASQAWRPGSEAMWADAWDETFQALQKSGDIPLGSFGAE